MVNSSTSNYSKVNLDVVNINTANKINLKKFAQNGQIQIYQSLHRGSYSTIIRDSLRIRRSCYHFNSCKCDGMIKTVRSMAC